MTMTPAAVTALSAVPYKEHRFIKVTLPTYTAAFWTGPGDVVVSGTTYHGVGSIGSAGPITDNSDLAAQRLQLQLSWLDTSLWAEVKDISHQGSPVEIMIAQLDGGDVIIPNPYDVFVGEVDTMSGTLEKYLTITVNAENFLSFMFRGPDGHRRTAQDQQFLFPNSGVPDLGMQFVANQLDNIPWGVQSSVTKKEGGTSSGSAAAARLPVTG